MDAQPTVEPVKNGWHALSRELNLAVFGATKEEARKLFGEAVAKDEEIRNRPDPKEPPPVGRASATAFKMPNR